MARKITRISAAYINHTPHTLVFQAVRQNCYKNVIIGSHDASDKRFGERPQQSNQGENGAQRSGYAADAFVRARLHIIAERINRNAVRALKTAVKTFPVGRI